MKILVLVVLLVALIPVISCQTATQVECVTAGVVGNTVLNSQVLQNCASFNTDVSINLTMTEKYVQLIDFSPNTTESYTVFAATM